MTEPTSGIIVVGLVAVAVIGVAGALFGMYIIGKVAGRIAFGVVGVADGIGRLIVGGPPRRRVATSALPRRPGGWRSIAAPPATLRCPRPRCHAENVPAAKFCRRCGSAMDVRASAANGPGLGRAAMW